MRNFGLITILAFGALPLFTGCAKDRDVDDYNHEQIAQYQAKMQSISGTYRGMINAKQGSSTLGAVSISLAPYATVNPGGSSLETLSQVSLQGTVGIEDGDGSIKQISFTKGAYDPTDGEFRATATITTDNGNVTQNVDINGTITNGQMTGEVDSEGYESFGGTFTAALNATAISAQQLKDSGVGSTSLPIATNYTSTVNLSTGGTDQYDMSILDGQATVEQRFLNDFQPVKFVNVSVRNHKYQQAAILITGAQWDQRTGQLTGEAISTGASPYDVVLTCQGTPTASGQESFSCTYTDHLSGPLFTGVFTPIPATLAAAASK
jgi:hypothetical protein